jgi:hypothetical protein
MTYPDRTSSLLHALTIATGPQVISLDSRKFKPLKNPVTASLKRGQQLSPRHCVLADTLRQTDPVPSPQHLDPHAAGIVKVVRDHSHGSPGHARFHHGPLMITPAAAGCKPTLIWQEIQATTADYPSTTTRRLITGPHEASLQSLLS